MEGGTIRMSNYRNKEIIKRVRRFTNAAEVCVCKPLEQESNRFPSAEQLVYHIRRVHNRLNKIGSVEDPLFFSTLKTLCETHNKACVALMLLRQEIDRLDYEWQEAAETKKIDFLVHQSDERLWVEVKTIHPGNIDAWENFERMCKDNRITEQVHIHLDSNSLGGEIWHHMKASRSKSPCIHMKTV
jgi:hypothetical protein